MNACVTSSTAPSPNDLGTLAKFRLDGRLRTARAAVPGCSQAELARRITASGIAMPASKLCAIELGYRDATWSEVEAISNALGTDPYTLGGLHRPQPITSTPKLASPAPPPPPQATSSPVSSRMPPSSPPMVTAANRAELTRQLAAAETLLLDKTLKPQEWRAWRDYIRSLRAALAASL